MKIIKFFKWWWSNITAGTQLLVVLLGWFLPHLTWFIISPGMTPIFSLFGTFLGFVLICMLILLADHFIIAWAKFKKYEEFEQEKVADALRGKHVRQNPYTIRKID